MIFVIAVCAGIIIAMNLEQKAHHVARKCWKEIPPPVDFIMGWRPKKSGKRTVFVAQTYQARELYRDCGQKAVRANNDDGCAGETKVAAGIRALFLACHRLGPDGDQALCRGAYRPARCARCNCLNLPSNVADFAAIFMLTTIHNIRLFDASCFSTLGTLHEGAPMTIHSGRSPPISNRTARMAGSTSMTGSAKAGASCSAIPRISPRSALRNWAKSRNFGRNGTNGT